LIIGLEVAPPEAKHLKFYQKRVIQAPPGAKPYEYPNCRNMHIHLLVGYKPNQNLSDLVRDIKCNSTNWINDNHLTNRIFNWQEGYGAFSYTHWDLDKIINYIIRGMKRDRVKLDQINANLA
jgi:hypothetical protein